jgi:hypothetical protein
MKMSFEQMEYLKEQEHYKFYSAMCVIVSMILAFILLLSSCDTANAWDMDMKRIERIESSGDPLAWNQKDDSRGLYQITPICLQEWNNYHPRQIYSVEDLWDVGVNFEIADWYINKRIPKMLDYYGIKDTVENRIIAYNAGIRYLIDNKPLPKITRDYIQKYYKLGGKA